MQRNRLGRLSTKRIKGLDVEQIAIDGIHRETFAQIASAKRLTRKFSPANNKCVVLASQILTLFQFQAFTVFTGMT
jgi:hypothetical protein